MVDFPAGLVSWMVNMLKTWHEIKRICGEWSCFHCFFMCPFPFEVHPTWIHLKNQFDYLDASTLIIVFQQTAVFRFLPPLSMGWASRSKLLPQQWRRPWLNIFSLQESSGAFCSASHVLVVSGMFSNANSPPSKLDLQHESSRFQIPADKPSTSPQATIDPSKVIAANALLVAWSCCTFWRDPWTAWLSPPGSFAKYPLVNDHIAGRNIPYF